MGTAGKSASWMTLVREVWIMGHWGGSWGDGDKSNSWGSKGCSGDDLRLPWYWWWSWYFGIWLKSWFDSDNEATDDDGESGVEVESSTEAWVASVKIGTHFQNTHIALFVWEMFIIFTFEALLWFNHLVHRDLYLTYRKQQTQIVCELKFIHKILL